MPETVIAIEVQLSHQGAAETEIRDRKLKEAIEARWPGVPQARVRAFGDVPPGVGSTEGRLILDLRQNDPGLAEANRRLEEWFTDLERTVAAKDAEIGRLNGRVQEVLAERDAVVSAVQRQADEQRQRADDAEAQAAAFGEAALASRVSAVAAEGARRTAQGALRRLGVDAAPEEPPPAGPAAAAGPKQGRAHDRIPSDQRMRGPLGGRGRGWGALAEPAAPASRRIPTSGHGGRRSRRHKALLGRSERRRRRMVHQHTIPRSPPAPVTECRGCARLADMNDLRTPYLRLWTPSIRG